MHPSQTTIDSFYIYFFFLKLNSLKVLIKYLTYRGRTCIPNIDRIIRQLILKTHKSNKAVRMNVQVLCVFDLREYAVCLT